MFNTELFGSIAAFKSKPINVNHERQNVLELQLVGDAGDELSGGVLEGVYEMVDRRGSGTKAVIPIPVREGSPVSLDIRAAPGEDDNEQEIVGIVVDDAAVSQVVLVGVTDGPPEYRILVEFNWEEEGLLFIARHHRRRVAFYLNKTQTELDLTGGTDETAI